MSAPRPDTVERMALDVMAVAKTASVDYGWLYDSGYRRGRHGASAKTAVAHGKSDVSDLLVGSIQRIRSKLDEGAKSFERALRGAAPRRGVLQRCGRHHRRRHTRRRRPSRACYRTPGRQGRRGASAGCERTQAGKGRQSSAAVVSRRDPLKSASFNGLERMP